MLLVRVAVGLVLSAAVAWVAYYRRSLSGSGVVGAILVGTLVWGFGGWVWGILLAAFFVSSSLLSHYRQDQKRESALHFAKGGQRDLGQVLANGGWGAALAVLHTVYPGHTWLFHAFVGSIAAVTADTWATELGLLSRNRPRLITIGRQVPPGTSGAVSLLGTVASVVGASLIGFFAHWLSVLAGLLTDGFAAEYWVWLPLVAAGSGLLGSFFDSLLGATVQATYYCEKCEKMTEDSLHRCGEPAKWIRGLRFLDNDMVNFLSSAIGAAASGLIGYWLVH